MTTDGFHNVIMPRHIAFGSTGGLEHRTEIVQMASGHEYRNAPWRGARRRYNIVSGARPLAEIQELSDFFNARSGRLFGFLWRDIFDDQSTKSDSIIAANDQTLVAADDTNRRFNLVKRYGSGTQQSVRRITKPQREGFVLAVDGVSKTIDRDFMLESHIGQVRFRRALAVGARVTAGFEFYVPVRFDTDRLDIELVSFDTGYLSSVPLIELRGFEEA